MAQFEVRRPFGRASVFYARTSDGWVSSSRLRSLASRLRSSVNLPVLARWTAVVQEPTDETLFLGIRHLPPCHAFVNGKLSTIAPKPASAPEGSLEELGRLLRRRVESAVEKATLGSRCIGVTVGGLDSCGIAAITSTGESSTVWVNVDLRGEDPDRPYVKALARRHGVRLITRTVDEGEAFLADALLLDGIPCWTAGVVVDLVAATALREAGVDRILSGAVGDDVFGGDVALIGGEMLRTSPAQAIRFALQLRTPHVESPRQRLMRAIVRPNVREWVPKAIRTRRRKKHFARRFHWAKPAFLELLDASGDAQEVNSKVPTNREELFGTFTTAGWLADYVDCRALVAAVTHLPWLEPCLDLELVRFTLSLPYEVRNCDGFHRGLYRRALTDLLPDKVRQRTGKASQDEQVLAVVRRAFQTPTWRDRLRVPLLADLGWVDPHLFQTQLEALENADQLAAMWPFLSAEAFLQAQS